MDFHSKSASFQVVKMLILALVFTLEVMIHIPSLLISLILLFKIIMDTRKQTSMCLIWMPLNLTLHLLVLKMLK